MSTDAALRALLGGLQSRTLSPLILRLLAGEAVDFPHDAGANLERAALVERAAGGVRLRRGERVSESALNERLSVLVKDVAFFRRHGVDLGILHRKADGSEYWLSPDLECPPPLT